MLPSGGDPNWYQAQLPSACDRKASAIFREQPKATFTPGSQNISSWQICSISQKEQMSAKGAPSWPHRIAQGEELGAQGQRCELWHPWMQD